jgi:Arf-GAP/GTPase/ANK repeat/PH domain-containing protein 1/3
MSHYRHMGDLPLLLVATRDHVTDARPRLVDEARARALARELGRCVPLHETCALNGHNVERVFYDACHRVVNWRAQMLVAMANIAAASSTGRPLTPSQQQQQQQQVSQLLPEKSGAT